MRYPDHVPRVYDVSGPGFGRSGIYDATLYAQAMNRMAEKADAKARSAITRREHFERMRDYYRKEERKWWQCIYNTLAAADERRTRENQQRYDTLVAVRSGETAS